MSPIIEYALTLEFVGFFLVACFFVYMFLASEFERGERQRKEDESD